MLARAAEERHRAYFLPFQAFFGRLLFKRLAFGVALLLLYEVTLADELCYLIRSGAGYTTENLLTPVAKFPTSHPKATGTCGSEETIPQYTSFPKGAYDGCTRTRGSEAYYAYDFNDGTSANTGYEEKDTLLLYFLVETETNSEDEVYFVLVADSKESAGDTDGGQVTLEIDVTPVSAAANVGLASADDSCAGCGCVDALSLGGSTWTDSENYACSSYDTEDWCDLSESDRQGSGWRWYWGDMDNYKDSYGTDATGACCACGGGDVSTWPATTWDACAGYSHTTYEDCYAFDPSLGKGTFAWKYPSCCTDGMSLGPLPIDEFCFTIHIETTTGLSKVKLGSWVESSNTINKIEVGIDDVRTNGLQVATLLCCPPVVRHPSI
ncbi:hypothetical protein CYMTET_28567 [Cymbomonas tetramitiformis]|uniref:Uncharacterized protein n=1 Tax=Cymbomonas tetramitiformis TaxID=36881 RepID=A0AAE0FMN5_9CHLO|nr:hypothetical protein CYMTET_28567 [Cymbomonas tetramitiformis]